MVDILLCDFMPIIQVHFASVYEHAIFISFISLSFKCYQFYIYSGYWLFHCHIEFHAEVGMSLVFKVGEHEDMIPVPRNFPSCGNWQPEDTRHGQYAVEILPDAATKPMQDILNATVDISENSVQQLVKLFPQVLQALRISSSSCTLATSYFLLSFSYFVVIYPQFL